MHDPAPNRTSTDVSEVTTMKDISTAIIKTNKTDLKPGTVKAWSKRSLNPLLMVSKYKDWTTLLTSTSSAEAQLGPRRRGRSRCWHADGFP